jgi:formate dehydrogenase major subunit
MAITRREFLKYTAVAGAALYLGIFDLNPIKAYAEANPPLWASEAISVCGYCSVGCSMIVGSIDGSTLTGGTTGKKYAVYVQGNPDSPINKGALCSKGSASAQFSTIVDAVTGERVPNPGRLTKVLYRAKNTIDWVESDWATEMPLIAAKVKATRDAVGNFTETDGPITVNRCTGIASLGAAALNNEACYLITKLMRSLGVVYLEHQARV